ncbi:MAG TPA: (2Fe-2S) ferredoxin domain-containing protein [Thermoanaerobaculia bacterium]
MNYPFEKLFLVCIGARCVESRRGNECGLAIQKELKAYNKALGRKRSVRVCQVSCLDLCDDGPNMLVYPGGSVHSHLTRAKARKIYDDTMQDPGKKE